MRVSISLLARGWAPDALLESYHHERHAAARENLAVTTATMDVLETRGAAAAAYRRVLTRAAADLAAHELIDSGRLAHALRRATGHPQVKTGAEPR